jgi:uncharacterized membrane protein
MTAVPPDGRRPDRKPEKKPEKKSEDRSRTPRLDVPREVRSPLMGRILDRATAPDQDRLGRFAERFARFLGTARFLIYMTLFVVVWVGWNWAAPKGARFDDYPFIFLTLILSLQASYAAPLILLAQNRQDDRDRIQGEYDRGAAERNQADVEYLTREIAALRMALGEVATRDYIRSELQRLQEELQGQGQTTPGPREPR